MGDRYPGCVWLKDTHHSTLCPPLLRSSMMLGHHLNRSPCHPRCAYHALRSSQGDSYLYIVMPLLSPLAATRPFSCLHSSTESRTCADVASSSPTNPTYIYPMPTTSSITFAVFVLTYFLLRLSHSLSSYFRTYRLCRNPPSRQTRPIVGPITATVQASQS